MSKIRSIHHISQLNLTFFQFYNQGHLIFTYVYIIIINFLKAQSRLRYVSDIQFTGCCDTSVIRFRQIDQGSDVDGMQQTPSKLCSFIHVTYHLCSVCCRIGYAFTCPTDAGLHLYSKCRSWMNTETTNMNPKCRITYLTWKEKGISYWLEELLLLKSSQACIVKCPDDVCMAMYGDRNGNHKSHLTYITDLSCVKLTNTLFTHCLASRVLRWHVCQKSHVNLRSDIAIVASAFFSPTMIPSPGLDW